MRIHTLSSSEEAKKGLAARVSSELASFQENGTTVLFLFSGGSALSVLDMIDPQCIGDFLTMAPVDERFDPTGKASNFAAFMGTDFFRKAESVGARFIDTRVKEGQGRDDLADELERTIRKWIAEYPDGRIIAILGMGPDGHTMGIFPSDDAPEFHDRFEGDRLAIGYRAPEYATCPERVTATLSFLEKNIDQAFVFLSGEEKRAAWERVLRNDEPIHLLPTGIFHGLRRVKAFTDLR